MTIYANLIEQEYLDVDDSTVKTARWADKPYRTLPGETPASTLYEPCVKDLGTLQRNAFGSATTSGQMGQVDEGMGVATLTNVDAALDDLRRMAFDSRHQVRRRGPLIGGAYPADFPVVFSGVATQPHPGLDVMSLGVQDQRAALNKTLQPTKFAGNNALPAGLEGTADLAGKPKPITIGSPFNVAPPPVNTSKLIYQFHDAAATVGAVRDRGISLTAGQKWVQRTAAIAAANHYLYTSHYAAGLYLTAGVDFTGSPVGILATSPDGVTWTTRSLPGTPVSITASAYGASLYVVGGQYSSGGAIYTSPDGITWTQRASSFGADSVASIVWGADVALFVATGTGGKIATSPDGITWTQQTSPFLITDVVNAVIFARNIFVAVGGAIGTIATSLDGITWIARTATLASVTFSTVVYSDALGMFLAGGDNPLTGLGGTNTCATSPDGITWFAQDGFLGTDIILGLAADATCVAVLGGSGELATSTDGVTWSIRTGSASPFGSNALFSIISDGTQFLATGLGKIYQTTTAIYSTTTELLSDALAPNMGGYGILSDAGGSFFRLGGSPAGLVTCDPIEGATSADRTAAQCFVRVLQRMGYSSGAWSASDVTTLDGKTTAVLGHYIDADTDAATILSLIAASVGAFWFADRQGVFRIRRLEAPSGSSSVLKIRELDITPRMTPRQNSDVGGGVPTYSIVVQYGRNYSVQSPTDLAGGVSDANRQRFGQQWQQSTATDSGVLVLYPSAVQRTDPSLLTTKSDADTESARRQSIWGVRREGYDCPLEWGDDVVDVELGDEVTLYHSRNGLSGGAHFVVLGISDNPGANRITPSLWGRAA